VSFMEPFDPYYDPNPHLSPNRPNSNLKRAKFERIILGMEIDNTGRRSLSRVGKRQRRDESGLKSETEKKKAEKLKRMGEKKWKSEARKGAADRRVLDLKPKHLNSGKRGIGKTDWR